MITISADSRPKTTPLQPEKRLLADKLTGNVVKEIYVPKKIINIVQK